MQSVEIVKRRDINGIIEIVLNGNKTKQLQCCLLPSYQRQKREKREKLAESWIFGILEREGPPYL